MNDIGQPDRKTYIGGSDVAAILGVSPWKSKLQLWQEKTGEFVEEISREKEKIFSRGKRWEPVVIEMLLDELKDRGHDVEVIGRNNRYQDKEIDYLAAEIDLELLIDGARINGEMKTVHPFAAGDWGEQGTDDIPMYYTAQVLHGQMITGDQQTVVAALIGADDLRVYFVDRDDGVIQHIRSEEQKFWESIQAMQRPDPTTLDDILRLYGKDNGMAYEADEALMSLIRDLQDTKLTIKNAEAAVTRIQTLIGQTIKDASTVIYGGKPVMTWKTQSTNRLDVERIKTQAPGIYKQYLKTTDSRVLRLKK